MTIDKVLFRTQKEKMLLDFTSEALLHAMGEYFKTAGVTDPTRFPYGASKALELVKKEKDSRAKSFAAKKPAKLEQPYLQVGISGKDLACQIKDNKSKQESSVVMMKGFVTEIEKLKNANAAVVNISEDKNEKIIKNAALAQAKRLNTSVTTEDTTDFAGISGNIVLCAHGTPKVTPGRVIGVELGGKNAEQIVEILTGNPDKGKRIAKDYKGVITLSGCFTAAGGPASEKADPVFAQKVGNLLKSKGYKYCRVEGMPGSAWTATGKGETDAYGTPLKVGEKGSWHAMEDDEEAIQAYQMKIDQNIEKLNAASDRWTGTPEAFDAHPKVKELVAQMRKDSAEIDRLVVNQKNAQKASQVGVINPSKDIAHFKGYFGPEKYKSKPWYKKLFS